LGKRSTDVATAPLTRGSLLSHYSVEITAKDASSLLEAAPFMVAGTRVSITFLSNEDFAARVSAAQCVRELGFIPVPHLSARRFKSSQELERFLDDLANKAICRVCVPVFLPIRGPRADYRLDPQFYFRSRNGEALSFGCLLHGSC